MVAVHEEERGAVEVMAPRALPDCLDALDPMEAPWTVEVLLDCGPWTSYVNNFIGGGDISAIAPAVARMLGASCVVAEHMPRYGPGHAATQLWLLDSDGNCLRTLSAYAVDGRWSWDETGVAQPWEHPNRYRARRKRDRLDRALLVEYLEALGIRVDDPGFYRKGIGVRQHVDWPRRQVPVAAWRKEEGW